MANIRPIHSIHSMNSDNSDNSAGQTFSMKRIASTAQATRRQWFATALPLLGAGLLATALPGLARPKTSATPHSTATPLEVWKDPNCGCCHDWVTHMQANGFKVTVHDTGNNAVRARLGLPQKMGSCHTALVGGYVVEGHVPASDVRQLLAQKPNALGLAVPGMPVGAPGMDGPEHGNRRDRYDVLLVVRDGSSRIFNTYNADKKDKTGQSETNETNKKTGMSDKTRS